MHILLTRQLEDCSELIVRFKKLGHIVSHLPLLIVEKISYKHELFNGCKSIIFTSANGIKFLETKDIDFLNLFFNIWLREDSEDPNFTKSLLGKNK